MLIYIECPGDYATRCGIWKHAYANNWCSLVMIDKLGNGAACAPFRPQKFEENTLHTSYGNTLLLNENLVAEESISWHNLCYYRNLSIATVTANILAR